MNSYSSIIRNSLVLLAVLNAVAKCDSVVFTNDFSVWTLVSWSNPPGLEPGSWLAASNTDSLKWNLTTNAGAANRGKYYKFTSISTITNIEFDWRFSNDQFNSRLTLELLDDANTVLWSATSTAGGQLKPLNHVVVNVNANTIKFSYHQTDVIYGKPAFFDVSNQDDWDAFVDNITLTVNCAEILDGDINKDCVIDFKDLSLWLQDWLVCSHPDPSLCNPG